MSSIDTAVAVDVADLEVSLLPRRSFHLLNPARKMGGTGYPTSASAQRSVPDDSQKVCPKRPSVDETHRWAEDVQIRYTRDKPGRLAGAKKDLAEQNNRRKKRLR